MLATPTTQLLIYPGDELFSKLIDLAANILAITKYFAPDFNQNLHKILKVIA